MIEFSFQTVTNKLKHKHSQQHNDTDFTALVGKACSPWEHTRDFPFITSTLTFQTGSDL